jgi:YHS domain-containing protein
MTMKHRVNVAAMVAGVTLSVAAAGYASQQQPTQPQPGHNMPGMMQPAAPAAVAECAQAQPRAMQTIDAANLRLEAARQNNSPSAMRGAMDDLQAALGSLRTQLAVCAALQTAAAPDPQAGHVMPGGAQMPNLGQTTAAAPGTPVMRPGSMAPSAAVASGSAANPQAGHAMPGASSAPAPGRATPEPPRGASPAAPATEPHAGHVMPGAPPPAAPGRGTTPETPTASRQSSQPKTGAPRPQTSAAGGDHSGMTMPSMPKPPATSRRSPPGTGAPRSQTPQSAPGSVAAAGGDHAGMTMPTAGTGAAATDLAQLKCESRVNPKTVPRMLYQGRTYYFCSERERAEFAKNPENSVKAPAAQAKPAHEH